MSLLALPVEIIQHICSFIDHPSTLRALRLSCHKLNIITNNNHQYYSLFSNLFDPPQNACQYQEELVRRWSLLIPCDINTLDLKSAMLGSSLKLDICKSIVFDLQSGGRNAAFLKQAKAYDFLDVDISLTDLSAGWAGVLLLCSTMCADSSWEHMLRIASENIDEYGLPFDCAEAAFAYTGPALFSTTIRRSDDSSATADIAPLPFAGRDCYSTAMPNVLAVICKFMFWAMIEGETADIFSRAIPRPYLELSADSLSTPLPKRTFWLGVYIYMDYGTFQWLTGRPLELFPDNLFSDGTQTCHIEMHDDGSITGGGRGTYERANGGLFTIHGTWTRVSDCPAGMRRLSFHKTYQHEHHPSNWLYDGIMIPGKSQQKNGGLFVGRWKDDTQQFGGINAVTGPFLFWLIG